MSNPYDDLIALAPGEVPWLAKFQAVAQRIKDDVAALSGGYSASLTYGAQEPSSGTGVTLTNSSSRFQNVTMTATGQAVDMPDATTETEGRPWYIRNAGTNDFAIKANGGADLVAAVAAGDLYQVFLIDDSTAAGVWTVAKIAGAAEPTSFIGEIRSKAGSTLPTGWHRCDGSAISRTTYADLFTEIGTTYGVGDGSTTFNIPDMRGQVLGGINNSGLPNGENGSYSTRNEGATVGTETHTLTESEMPSHNHNIGLVGGAPSGPNGPRMGTDGVSANVSTGSTGSGSSHNNMQPTIFVPFIIYTGVWP